MYDDYGYNYSQPKPQTIEELQDWYVAHHLPPESITRFYIGKNYFQPKAFGIYRDGNNYVVYKNKADGSRAIRYEGPDEAYAVNELYMKLKERIAEQKSTNPRRSSGSTANSVWTYAIIIGFVCIIAWSVYMSVMDAKKRGYYRYEGEQYYYLDGDWYWYDTYYDDWTRYNAPYELRENYEDYYESSSYNPYYGASDFTKTDYYIDWSETDNDSDWDSDWDSWDSGGGDWDSDW